MERTILHADMDAYFASVEEKSNPFLKGKPVIVSGDPETRTTVATANYEARKYGIKSGMPLRQALTLCPRAEIVAGNSAKYLYTTSRLLEIFREFTSRVECYSIDEAFLDITESKERFGGAIPAAQKIKESIKRALGLTCSVGIATNRLLAKLASDSAKPDGLTLIRKGEVRDLMKNLPVGKLCGIGEKLAFKLDSMGIYTCGNLADCPEERLVRVFGGIQGRLLRLMGMGEYSSHVNFYWQEPEHKSMGHSYTLFRDSSDPLLLQSTLYRLCEQVARRLRKGGYRGRTVTLITRFSDFQTFVRQKSTGNHTCDACDIYRTALSIMKSFEEEKSVRLLGVSVSNLVKGESPVSLFEKERRRDRLVYASDRINDKFGEMTLSSGMVLMEKSLAEKRYRCRGHIRKK